MLLSSSGQNKQFKDVTKNCYYYFAVHTMTYGTRNKVQAI